MTGIGLSESKLPLVKESDQLEMTRSIKEMFQVEWKRRNSNSSDVPRLPQPDQPIDLRGIDFSRPVVYTEFLFGRVDFSGSHFRGDATFYLANFLSGVSFKDVFFEFDVSFSETNFHHRVTFVDAIFDKKCSFQSANFRDDSGFYRTEFVGDVDFTEAQFSEICRFLGSKFFGKAIFFKVRFAKSANFNLAIFHGLADFKYVTFAAGAEFAGLQDDLDESNARIFAGGVDFSYAHFQKYADFYGRRFGVSGNANYDVDFSNAVFEGYVSFEKSTFASALPILANCTLPLSTNVTARAANWPTLAPGILTRVDLAFRLLKSPTYSKQNPEIVKASAASLRHAMSRQMLPEEEHFFFRREMWAAGRTGPWLHRLPVLFYGAMSDYGHSVGRPMSLLVLLWLIGAAAYAAQIGFSAAKALVYSFAVMFKFLGLQGTYLEAETKRLGQTMEFFAGTQTVFAFIFLFFLGLGLRTRFRLR